MVPINLTVKFLQGVLAFNKLKEMTKMRKLIRKKKKSESRKQREITRYGREKIPL